MPSKHDQLDALRLRILALPDFPLRETARNLVCGKGNPGARIFLIGEAPGRQEDEQGIPFVGAAGKYLDSLLASIGLCADDVYIANILKCRPPNNRNPHPEEISAHTPYLIEQIKIIRPELIVTLGNFATKFVLSGFSVDGMKSVPGIARIHGKVCPLVWQGKEFSILPLYHPAAVFYNPLLRKIMQKDFKNLAKFLAGSGRQVKKI